MEFAVAALVVVEQIRMVPALILPFEVLTAYAGSTVDNTVHMPWPAMPILRNLYYRVLAKNKTQYDDILNPPHVLALLVLLKLPNVIFRASKEDCGYQQLILEA